MLLLLPLLLQIRISQEEEKMKDKFNILMEKTMKKMSMLRNNQINMKTMKEQKMQILMAMYNISINIDNSKKNQKISQDNHRKDKIYLLIHMKLSNMILLLALMISEHKDNIKGKKKHLKIINILYDLICYLGFSINKK